MITQQTWTPELDVYSSDESSSAGARFPSALINYRVASRANVAASRERCEWDTPGEESFRRIHENSAKRRARTAIDQLFAEGLISSGVAWRAIRLVSYIFSAKTIFVSIAPEEAGLIFYWVAGEMAIEIDVCADGSYWWGVENVGGDSYFGGSVDLPVEELRHSLNIFSKEVDSANPHWRDAFRQMA
ncbi:hypothetical protein [Nocardia noduli]|uniref:hypothetical protein n=1 Tax=Nocardia noduli TaxID=2815722 RepID=UPI001C226776|nr:hypothetical protein [Nocardia noduli]